MRVRTFVLAFLLTGVGIVILPAAEAGSATPMCAQLLVRNSASPTSYWAFRVSTDSETRAVTSCPAGSDVELLEGECRTFNLKYATEGGLAPAPPQVWEVHWLRSAAASDHSTTGKGNWAAVRVDRYAANPHLQTVSLCATQDGTSTGVREGDTFRAVLRACRNSIGTPATCDASTLWDMNTDANTACACVGNQQGSTTVTATYGTMVSVYDAEVRDPLTLGVRKTTVATGTAVNVTIDARFLNNTMRPSAASNITVHVLAPDGTWPVDGATPTEMTFSDGTGMGRYYYSFTPAQEGKYEIVARTISSLNERHVSKPLVLDVVASGELPVTRGHIDGLETRLNATLSILATSSHLANTNGYLAGLANSTGATTDALLLDVQGYLATLGNATSASDQLIMLAVQNYIANRANETTAPLATSTLLLAVQNYLALDENATHSDLDATLTEVLANIQDANNTSSGALSYSTWYQWNTGEFRPLANTTNGTARETSITLLRNSTDGASNGIYARLEKMENSTFSSWVASQWAEARPNSRNDALILIGAVGLVTGGLARGRRDRKEGANILLGGLVLAIVYLVTM